jgi:glycogen operon protein
MPEISGKSNPSPLPEGVIITPGGPYPLGATWTGTEHHFAIVSRAASALHLAVFCPGDDHALCVLRLDPQRHRTGDVWHVAIAGLPAEIEYGYWLAAACEPGGGVETPLPVLLLDPYARSVSGAETWGELPARSFYPYPWDRLRPRRARVVLDDFDWGDDRPLNRPLADAVIYEVHVRGFTQHPSSGVRHPGTFLGLVEKIPYLQELGITALELLPIAEFEEHDNPRHNPITGERLHNCWGYHPLAFFAPKAAYAARSGRQIHEFKTLVKALHEAGIEVILDVVFNHTGEGDAQCPTWSYRALDNDTYYLMDVATGAYRNDTGCGNTLNCNHPIVQDLIVDCLRYWVREFHVDGFRFDLASVLSRGLDGEALERPPVIERIAADPILAHTKLIAEPWDAAGLYQLGTFPRWGRWAEWNDQFRDDIRRFVKGDTGLINRLASRLTGSGDVYGTYANAASRSVNFVTCHDGFTLADWVTYTHKHNEANGEAGRDGMCENFSWNCGVEGPSCHPEVRAFRQRQMKNALVLLLLAQGVPMLLAGDEMGRTQHGNNNAYCQDNALSWVNWEALDCHRDYFRFVKLLVHFRQRHAVLRRRWHSPSVGGEVGTVAWHGIRRGQPDWSEPSRTLALHLVGGAEEIDLFLIVNAHWEGHGFELPPPSAHKQWHGFVDTLRPPPADIAAPGKEALLVDPRHYTTGPRSVVVLVGKPNAAGDLRPT